jgi:hypothetical protein
VEDRHDPLICLDQLHDLRVMRLPRREEPLSPFSKLGMAVERPRLRYLGREDDLALAVKEGKHRLDVRLIPGVHEPRDDLDVLLRHRLPRETGGIEGFIPGSEAEDRSDDPSLAELVEVELVDIDRDAARFALPLPMRRADHGVRAVDGSKTCRTLLTSG